VGLSKALKEKFKTVFDYKDGKSIEPGQPWLTEIFQKLSKSTLGISLMSKDYFESGNCAHEAQQMVAQKDNANLHLLPLKLYEGELELPPWIQDIQYLRLSDYGNDPRLVAQEIVNIVDRLNAGKPAGEGDKKPARR
jgi:hypothetical protein